MTPSPFVRMNSVRIAPVLAVLSLLAAACRSVQPPPAPDTQSSVIEPQSFLAELDHVANLELWPGFNLRNVPAAVFDGTRTLLFRHPAPPEGFTPEPAVSGVWSYPGRHPLVTANSSIDLGGVHTATALLTNPATPLRSRAAVVAHEAFHVFQRANHPGWSANEGELFVYPVDDARLLALRRLESMGLSRAAAADNPEQSACWARAALASRQKRYATLPAGSVEYERRTELNEGLARYVQRRAAGAGPSVVPEHPPEEVRARAYESGAALALLLDRFSPAWKLTLAQSDSLTLDMLLDSAPPLAGPAPCGFTAQQLASVDSAALVDVQQLRLRRASLRESLIAQPGWRLSIVAGESPLFPQRFDPLNVQVVGPGEVLHSRFVRLGNDAGTVEVFGKGSITEAAGAHPLFNGIRLLIVTGLAEPVVTETDGAVTIRGDGLTADFRGATVHRSGDSVTVSLGARP